MASTSTSTNFSNKGQETAFDIMSLQQRTLICDNVLLHHAVDEAFCAIYTRHRTLIASPDNQAVRQSLPQRRPKSGVSSKLIEIFNFPLVIPLQITQLQDILWQLHQRQKQA